MASDILLTGTTGYIGGSVFDAVYHKYPEAHLTALLRNVPDNFEALYPRATIVKGSYDDTVLLEDTASKMDIVVHCGDSDHLPCLQALLNGLHRRAESSSPAFLIHLSGTGVLFDWLSPKIWGTYSSKIWSDVDDLGHIKNNIPEHVIHRRTEKLLFSSSSKRVKIAVVSPPDIYGAGRGPVRKQSVFIPTFLREIKNLDYPFYVNEGENRRSFVHIEDLTRLYLHLIDAALRGGEGADWGSNGYYFAATHDVSQRKIAEKASQILGLPDAKSVSLEVVDGMMKEYAHYGIPLARNIFAFHSVQRADRAAERFEYEGSMPTVLECMEGDLKMAKESC